MMRVGALSLLPNRSVHKRRLGCRLIASCFLLFITQGCQQHPTTVSGRVTLDGRPLAVPSDSRGTIVFHPEGGSGTISSGLLDSTGQFRLATGSSRDIAPGKYSVTVAVSQALPKSENEEQGARLISPAKYASARDSDLEASVERGRNNFSFDLSSRTDEQTSKSTDEALGSTVGSVEKRRAEND
jgi:hypothetical protein